MKNSSVRSDVNYRREFAMRAWIEEKIPKLMSDHLS